MLKNARLVVDRPRLMLPDLFSILGYRRRWSLLSLLSKPSISQSAPIVMGGCESSGTTLLRVLLGRHPQIACGRESTVFLGRISGPHEIGPRFGFDPAVVERWQRESPSQTEFIERFEKAVLNSAGKPIWAEKTPGNVSRFAFIRQHFPRARLIHIIRDGRDVVCSLRRRPNARLRGNHWASPEALGICADHWARRVSAGRRLLGDPGYLEVHYEDLVREPEPVLRAVLDFVGLEWSDRLLVPEEAGRDTDEMKARSAVFDDSVGRWPHEFSVTERKILGRRIGSLLLKLGYPPDAVWASSRRPQREVPAVALATDASIHSAALPVPGAVDVGSRDQGLSGWYRKALKALPRPVRASVANFHVLYHAAKDRRIPWLARVAASIGVAYYLSPIDLIPDHIPVVGYLDDVTVLWIGLRIAVALSPPGVMTELKNAAATSFGLL